MKASDGRFEPGSPRLQDDSGMDEMAPVTHQIRGRNLAVGTIQLYVLGLWRMETYKKPVVPTWCPKFLHLGNLWKHFRWETLKDVSIVGVACYFWICVFKLWRFTGGDTVSLLKSLAYGNTNSWWEMDRVILNRLHLACYIMFLFLPRISSEFKKVNLLPHQFG